MKRMYVNLTDAQITSLKDLAQHNGSSVSEEIRRAVSHLADIWARRHEMRAETEKNTQALLRTVTLEEALHIGFSEERWNNARP